ncbi:MAG: TatD family hydrolase [Spirochaetales bacterium]|nr:TatD family hydrolase [Spirochaetales bacterium]
MKLFDAHIHLHDHRFDANREELISRARDKGVRGFCSLSADPGDWPRVIENSRKYPFVLPGFGIHPWYLKTTYPGWREDLAKHLETEAAILGEVGLDLVIDTPLEEQMAVLHQQLDLAQDMKLPVNFHCRKAWHVLEQVLKAYDFRKTGFVLHAYSGTDIIVEKLASKGAYFSFGGGLTKSGNRRVHKAIKAVPLDRLLIETDAPDIPPVIDHKIDNEKPNVPENIFYVLSAMAADLAMTEEKLAEMTWENSMRLFGDVILPRKIG